MKAAVYEEFKAPLGIQNVPDPTPSENGVVVRVQANGICRSDWHAWQGHDPDVKLPHVPGHELSGIVEALGHNVKNWKVGDRVTVPFVSSCGRCDPCHSGNQQICDHQSQPGFTHWGSYAEFVAIDHADINLVSLPEGLDFVTAASLGCRFSTSFRAVVAQGKVRAGQWVAVHGCGGVGLSAVMIAKAMGAQVIAIDINEDQLEMAHSLGAKYTLMGKNNPKLLEEIKDLSRGGVHVSLDALGSTETCCNSIGSLRKQGRHVQVGLMAGKDTTPPIPMGLVLAHELEIVGTHGMQAFEFRNMLDLILDGSLQPQKLIGKTICLEESLKELETMDRFTSVGLTVINQF